MRLIPGKEFGFYLDERLDNNQAVLLVHFTQEPNYARVCQPSGYAMKRLDTNAPTVVRE